MSSWRLERPRMHFAVRGAELSIIDEAQEGDTASHRPHGGGISEARILRFACGQWRSLGEWSFALLAEAVAGALVVVVVAESDTRELVREKIRSERQQYEARIMGAQKMRDPRKMPTDDDKLSPEELERILPEPPDAMPPDEAHAKIVGEAERRCMEERGREPFTQDREIGDCVYFATIELSGAGDGAAQIRLFDPGIHEDPQHVPRPYFEAPGEGIFVAPVRFDFEGHREGTVRILWNGYPLVASHVGTESHGQVRGEAPLHRAPLPLTRARIPADRGNVLVEVHRGEPHGNLLVELRCLVYRRRVFGGIL